MNYIKSTYEVIALKTLRRSFDHRWIDWAVNMLIAGFETEHLIELAGESPPLDRYEIWDLTNKVFNELGLSYDHEEKAISNYVYFLGEKVIQGKREILPSLQAIKEIYEDPVRSYANLSDFYALYFAKKDLILEEEQQYWPAANRSNVDQICLDYFRKWMLENPLQT